jgi:streptogramin lyase
MSITYGGCTPACGGLNLPSSLAIDSGGNVLVANYFGGVVSKFSPTGVPAAANGFPGSGLNQSYGVAIDGSDNVWVTNEQSVTAANNHHTGSISEFSSAGVELSGYGYTGGGIYYPLAEAADSTGVIWLADYGSSAATLLLTSNGSAVSGGSGYGASALPFTSAVAVDSSHNAWFAVQGGAVRVTPDGTVSSYSCCSDPSGIAIDLAGDVWIADYAAPAIVELTVNGAVARQVDLGANAGPKGIAIDGAGNVWAANYYGNTLAEVAGSTGTLLSPTQGLGLDAPVNEPYGLAIDASGNLWLTNAHTNTLTQFVGLASPVKTPLLGPPVQP